MDEWSSFGRGLEENDLMRTWSPVFSEKVTVFVPGLSPNHRLPFDRQDPVDRLGRFVLSLARPTHPRPYVCVTVTSAAMCLCAVSRATISLMILSYRR